MLLISILNLIAQAITAAICFWLWGAWGLLAVIAEQGILGVIAAWVVDEKYPATK